MSERQMLAIIKRYMRTYPAFRARPVGAPGSQKRIEQEDQIDLEDDARAAIAKAEGRA